MVMQNAAVQPLLCDAGPPFRRAPAMPTSGGNYERESEPKRLTEAVRKAGADLDAATTHRS